MSYDPNVGVQALCERVGRIEQILKMGGSERAGKRRYLTLFEAVDDPANILGMKDAFEKLDRETASYDGARIEAQQIEQTTLRTYIFRTISYET